ncbi:CrcB family protein, partial [Arthrospira platensis SPKY1]|nr:CrcB family protein [Arthrospira platensis SPKY1]
ALIGSVAGRFSIKPVSSTWQNFWQTGFCGGLTTLSLHSYDNFMLLKEHSWLDFSLYLTGTLVFCLMALLCAKTATERVCSRSQPKTEPKQPLP